MTSMRRLKSRRARAKPLSSGVRTVPSAAAMARRSLAIGVPARAGRTRARARRGPPATAAVANRHAYARNSRRRIESSPTTPRPPLAARWLDVPASGPGTGGSPRAGGGRTRCRPRRSIRPTPGLRAPPPRVSRSPGRHQSHRLSVRLAGRVPKVEYAGPGEPLMPETTADVLIVGAGASGAAFAWSLGETRMNVVCLEQGDWINPAKIPGFTSAWEVRTVGTFNCTASRG